VKIIRQNSTLLAIEQLPNKSTKVAHAVMSAVAIGFFIGVLILAHGLPWYAIAIGLFCPFVSFYLTLKATTEIVFKFDKKSNLLVIKRKNWFGEKVIQHYLNEIRSIRFKVYENKQDEGDTFEIGIILTSGSYVRLNEPSTSFDRANTESIASSINSFLNLSPIQQH
jgi:hypothetical protein